jgi:hypothetical protein
LPRFLGLLGAVAAQPDGSFAWCVWWFWVWAALAGVLVILTASVLSHIYFGKPALPQSHEEREERDRKRAAEEGRKAQARKQLLTRVLDELSTSATHIDWELKARAFESVALPGEYWSRHREQITALLSEAALSSVNTAHRHISGLRARSSARLKELQDFSEDRFHDPEWKRLADDEIAQRQAALAAIQEAYRFVADARQAL